MMISSYVLKGENYDMWVKAMRNALRAKNKLGFIDGTVSQPKLEEPEADLWEICNSMLVSWMFNSIDSALQPSVAYFETAKELWDDLREHFSVGNAPRIYQLKADIAAAKQQGQSIVAYYTRLKSMWDELSSYSRVPVCKCGGCKCNVTTELFKQREDEKVHQFLMGLDDSVFGTVRTNILSMDPLPNLSKIYSMVVQEERHRSVARGKEERSEAVGFVVHLNKTEFSQQKGGSGERRLGPRRTRWSRRTWQWWRRKRTRPCIANAVQGSVADSQDNNGIDSRSQQIPGLSEAQVQQIMTILANFSVSNSGASSEKLNGKVSNLKWILDSGASHHMTGDFECLWHVYKVPPSSVELPNGARTMAEQEGLVFLEGGISLKRDRNSRMLIGVGELRDGVYYYHSVASARACHMSKNEDFVLWHQRMGHPSTQITSLFSGVKYDSCVLKRACDICLKAKQTRDVFPTNKFESRSRKGVFVGYPFGKKGWRVYDLETLTGAHDTDDEIYCLGKDCNLEARGSGSENSSMDGNKNGGTSDIVDVIVEVQGDEDTQITGTVPVTQAEMPELGKRSRQPPTRLQDYICYTTRYDTSHTHLTSVSSSGTPYPIAHYVNCNNFSMAHRRFLAAVTKEKEPEHFGEAIKNTNWCDAMQAEIEALERNKTWTVEELLQGKITIGCKWVYRIKYNSDGRLERYKARLVALGNCQVEGINNNETFAPIAKIVRVRTFLAVVVAKGWELHQMDVHNAFLHGDLHEEVYMRLPPGFASSHPGKVCRLRKLLYGLCQAPRMWFSKLTATLEAYGFVQSKADYSLFAYNKGNDGAAIKRFKEYLSNTFHMKDLGVLKYFLGIEIARGPNGLFLSQCKYTLDILAECGLLGAKPAATPLEQNHHLSTATGDLMTDPEKYRRLVGRLIYLTITRLELCYSVHILAQFMQAPLQAHYDAALRVLRFLKGNPGVDTQNCTILKENIIFAPNTSSKINDESRI
ncbi:uncharacterized protein LOC144565545 [Carex rostrata]